MPIPTLPQPPTLNPTPCALRPIPPAAELQPEATDAVAKVLDGFETFYVYIFTLELALHVVAHWFWELVSDAWTYLDLLVVVISWVSYVDKGGGMSAIAVFRLFRVLRSGARLLLVAPRMNLLILSLPSLGSNSGCLLCSLLFSPVAAAFQDPPPGRTSHTRRV
jgi:hypothetical protein